MNASPCAAATKPSRKGGPHLRTHAAAGVMGCKPIGRRHRQDGSEIIAADTPEDIAKSEASHARHFLREVLARRQAAE
jgi:hypothetical protein